MANKAAGQGPPKNMYSEIKNDPEVLKKRQQAMAEVERDIQRMLTDNPGRVPGWEAERIMQMDRFCLENGKRCIMWDDTGAGFFLLLNWDWLHNRPSEPSAGDDPMGPGWWHNIRQLMRSPLLDSSLPDDRLAAWIDQHTMRVHHSFLEKLSKLRRDAATGRLVLEDPYWQQLQNLPPPAGSEHAQEQAASQPAAAPAEQ